MKSSSIRKESSEEKKTEVEVKVCGLTRAEDAHLAVELGACQLGFIFYPGSPRGIDFGAFREIRDGLPAVERIYVQVNPEPDELKRAFDEGFLSFQIHFPAAISPARVEAWAEIATVARLSLAPRIAPGEEFPEELLGLADRFLIDTYRTNAFGGTGETGDWGRFREWSLRWPEKRWILAGGLSPENIASALTATGTRRVDVNSGIESRAGLKNPERLRAFFAALRGWSL